MGKLAFRSSKEEPVARETINCVVMFADVAGSTAMYENMGDEQARERISKALDRLIAIIHSHSGTLVKTIGDEILVYFVDVDMAVYAARAIQDAMENDDSAETVGISIRIGMQFGSAIVENNDIFGDTVNVAARVASMAKARQILCTREVALMLKTNELSSNMRPYDRLRVKGKSEQLDVYLFAWKQEDDMTRMTTSSSIPDMAQQDQASKLTLKFNRKSHSILTDSETFVMGRGQDCQLVVKGELISRYHSKIEFRRGKFLMVDQSTNGTFIRSSGGQDIYLRREDFILFGSGHISLGKKVDLQDPNVIQYSCV